MRIHFGDCTLDTTARQLYRDERRVHLSPKAFELLTLLAESRPRAIAKDELLERVWQGVFVSDASLARVVNEVRDALGDTARDPRWLRTVHAFGYAFSGDAIDVDSAPPAASPCSFTCGGRRFPLLEGEQIIGRDADVAVSLDSPRVSRHHARVVARGAHATIEDLGSKNGTFVDGRRLERPADLKPGATVRIGPFALVFGVAGIAGSTETEVVG